jgi:opacity protein-like surface antigen
LLLRFPLRATLRILPTPVIEHIPQVPAAQAVWYLRGDIGYKIYGTIRAVQLQRPGDRGTLRFERESMDNAWMIGVGVGYKFNDYFRTDVTVDYETSAKVKGYAVCGGTCTGGYSTESANGYRRLDRHAERLCRSSGPGTGSRPMWGGTPLPNEGLTIWKDSHHEHSDARHAAGQSAFFLRPLRQAPRLDP